MDFLLLALSLSLPLGAVHGYRRVHAEATRWDVERRDARRTEDTYRDAGPSARVTRREVPAIVRLAAMLAGAGQYGLYALALLGVFYALAAILTTDHAPDVLVVALFFGLTLLPLAMAHALQRYLSALVRVQENAAATDDQARRRSSATTITRGDEGERAPRG